MASNLFEFDSEEEAIRVLQSEGKKLEDISIKVWRKYLSSYQPKAYVRTGNAEKSIKLGKVFKVDEDTLGIEVTFVNDLAYHDSVFVGSGHKKGHAIMLISSGWRVRNGWHKNIYRFGYYEGFNYLSKVQEEYDKVKDNRISLDIQWLGKKDYTR